MGRTERIASVAAGAALALIAAKRRGLSGAILATIGGGLLLRGGTGHCSLYNALGVDTCSENCPSGSHRGPHPARHGIHVVESLLINKSATDLYNFWRNFENLPRIMTHLEAVEVIDERWSRWIATAPWFAGGRVEWEAEIIRDEPGARIAWRSLAGSQIDQRGMVSFLPASGDRGVLVRVDIEYRPPAGRVGNWIAWLVGEDPAQQIHEDLRNFKRVMEIGEAITVEGQPSGSCFGRASRRQERKVPS